MMSHMAELTIILGVPASGKTTLARRLAVDLSLACLCKDDIKEALFDSLGTGDHRWSGTLSAASFAVLGRLAGAQLALGRSVIVEGNWRAAHAAVLRAALADGAARATQVWCCAEPAEIVRRFTQRKRHAGHLDPSVPRSEIEGAAPLQPSFLDLPGVRRVYSSDSPTAYGELIRSLKSEAV
jgi:predicted kinase